MIPGTFPVRAKINIPLGPERTIPISRPFFPALLPGSYHGSNRQRLTLTPRAHWRPQLALYSVPNNSLPNVHACQIRSRWLHLPAHCHDPDLQFIELILWFGDKPMFPRFRARRFCRGARKIKV